MPTLTTLFAFMAATCVLLMTPGPAMAYVVTRSLQENRRSGIASVLGLHTGTLVYVAAAVTGLTPLLTSSVTAFNIVKYLGAAYLVYLGVRTLLSREGTSESETATTTAPGVVRAYRQGAVVNVLNPKLGVFFLAFVPQFISKSAGSPTSQLVVLGLLFVVLGILIDGMWALLAATAGNRLSRTGRVRRRLKYVTGPVYIALGVIATLADPQATS